MSWDGGSMRCIILTWSLLGSWILLWKFPVYYVLGWIHVVARRKFLFIFFFFKWGKCVNRMERVNKLRREYSIEGSVFCWGKWNTRRSMHVNQGWKAGSAVKVRREGGWGIRKKFCYENSYMYRIGTLAVQFQSV